MPWMRWSIAVIAALVAMGLRGLLNPWIGNALPFVFAFPAVARWRGSPGWRPRS